ncbi:MAG: iron transporter [Candidatus Rokubacteria bacterium]|nr:iron transporter [Candidatus Rokubacteria bacterium]
MRHWRRLLLGAPTLAALVLSGTSGEAPAQGGAHHAGDAPKPAGSVTVKEPRRATMEELHRTGGVPPGWTFTLPPGDATRGRQLYVELECFKCHAIRGESFPPAGGDRKDAGPELTGMGGRHPAEYIAESILTPNAVIVEGPGHTGPDRLSIMPSYADSLTVPQLLDLVGYIASQRGGGEHAEVGPAAAREKVVGDYRIRLAYRAEGHLMVFITDTERGEPIPYLPVSAAVHPAGKPPRTVKLAPMMSDEGFHYGADIVLSADAEKISLSFGPPRVRLFGSAKGRFAKRETAVFELGHTQH